MNKESIQSLLSYYRANKCSLPWREEQTPYHTYISEIMLQQTRIETVKEYYLRFISSYPDVISVGQADIDNLQRLWQGLGYYSRIRNIHEACREMTEKYKGKIPDDLEKLLSLPGIGDYTAKAILAIAYNKKYIAVDGNLLRLYSRLVMSNDNIKDKKTKGKTESYFLENIPDEASDYLQALMELGETVCLPNGRPLCERCPLSSSCLAHKNHREMYFPISISKAKRIVEAKTILLFVYQDEVRINKRSENGLLAGLYEFVTIDRSMNMEDVNNYCKDKKLSIFTIEQLEKQSFAFTNRLWNMDGYVITLKSKADGIFVPISSLSSYAIPSVFSYYRNILMKRENNPK